MTIPEAALDTGGLNSLGLASPPNKTTEPKPRRTVVVEGLVNLTGVLT
jgi:hypothetical protein